MYLGHHIRKIDKSGRIRLPKEFLANGARSFILNRSFNSSLTLQNSADWEKTTKTLGAVDMRIEKNRDFVRYFYRGAVELHIDNKNRIFIHASLLNYIQAKNELLFIGLLNRIELWDLEVFNLSRHSLTPTTDGPYLSDDLGYFNAKEFGDFCHFLRMGEKIKKP